MKRFLLLLGLTIALPRAATAQTVGNLIGHVYDQSGTPIRGVKVVITSPTQIGGAKVLVTDDAGVFRIAGLTPGLFTVVASAPKLQTTKNDQVRISPATTTEIDLVMDVESATEDVRLTEKAPAIDTNSAAVGATFDIDFANDLPLSTRDSQGVTALAPGVLDMGGGGNPQIRGGSFFNNTYTVDGFQTTDPVTHTFTENFSFDAMSSVQVKTAAFGAEHSDTLGGVTNIVTKSGSNRFEVDTSAEYTDQHLTFFRDARDQGTKNRLAVASVSVGGPILKDRLWFYVSGEGVSNSFTLPHELNEPLHPSRNVLAFSGTGKLTWQITPRNKIDFTTRYEPGSFSNVLQSPLVEAEAEAHQQQTTRFVGAEWHSALSDKLLLQMRAGLNDNAINVEPQSCQWDPEHCGSIAAVVDLANSGLLERNYPSFNRSSRKTFELSGSVEWFADSPRLGSHDLKLGGRLESVSEEFSQTVPGDAIFTQLGTEPFARQEVCSNDPKNDNGACHHNWLYTDLTAQKGLIYLSEAWKPTRYLTITPEAALHIAKSADDKNRIVTDSMAVSPHLQVAWNATHDGRTVLRASFNNYVDHGFLALAGFTNRQLFSKRCNWDPMTKDYTANCRSQGGDGGTTVGLPCNPEGLNPDGTSCLTRLRLPRVWEYTLGVEREIVTGITVGADYIYRRYVHQWEDAETNFIWNKGGTGSTGAGNWKTGRSQFVFDLQTPDEAQRRYHSVTVLARKREGLLKMVLSYNWTRYEGTADADFATSFLDNPGQTAFYNGPLPGDIRHDVRAQATYQFRPWLAAGVVYQFQSGGPYNRYFYDTVYQGYGSLRTKRGYDTNGTVNPDDDTQLRMPDLSVLNLQARVSLQPLIHQPVYVYADLFNILSLRTATSIIEQDGALFGRTLSRLPATSARLGLQYRFR